MQRRHFLAGAALSLIAFTSCQTYHSRVPEPSPQYLNHPPQYIPAGESFPMTRELASTEPASRLAPRASTGQPYSAKPTPALATPPIAPPAPSVSSQTFTIANVRREPAILFTISATGELRFEKKLPPGEAVDLTTTPQTRWAAVFTTLPYQATCTFDPARPIWLLRGPAEPQRCEGGSGSLDRATLTPGGTAVPAPAY
ncbi:MAG: hypothetical protein U0840_13790 [Gemmataceae bacterium]